MSDKDDQARKQAVKVSPVSGVAPPVDKQFGKANGNPRHSGAWKKEDTARFKLEQMMKLSKSELNKVCRDDESPVFEKKLAEAILMGEWKEIEGMINQVYGKPKESIDHTTAGEKLNIALVKFADGNDTDSSS